MTLPNDIARCEGRMVTAGQGRAGCVQVSITHGQAECARCLRRTAGPSTSPQGTWHMDPPQFVDGRCPKRIAP